MRYYIIAGEASGDLHGSNLIKGIKKNDQNAEFRFLGGDLMQAQGGTLVKHFSEMAFMGTDVIFHLPAILGNMKMCKHDILAWKPDVLILIDYPGFNLRMAKFASKHNIKVFYYIAPKVWAWKEGRVKQLKKYIDRLFVIFPFEVAYFKKFDIQAEYFGNPLNDSVHEFIEKKESFSEFTQRNNLPATPILALVAGSRTGEITRILPEMLKATEGFEGYQVIVTGAPSVQPLLYEKIIGNSNVKVLFGQTYNVMAHASVAIVTSGTATLETALLRTPQVVVFKTNFLAYIIGVNLVRIKFFSLVNIIARREIVKEVLQLNLARQTRAELYKIKNEQSYKANMLGEYDAIARSLGEPGTADRLAKRIVSLLK